MAATALMAALDSLQLDAVGWLLEHGAEPRLVETNTGWSFSRKLASLQKKVESDNKAEKKIQEIIEKCVAKDMEWPPEKK